MIGWDSEEQDFPCGGQARKLTMYPGSFLKQFVGLVSLVVRDYDEAMDFHCKP